MSGSTPWPVSIRPSPAMGNVLNVAWMLHNLCNQRCSYCHPYNNSGSDRWLKYDQVIRFLENVFAHYQKDLYHFSFTGGEPTLWPEFHKLCAYLKERGCEIGVTTNGTRHGDFWDRSKDLFNWVCVSYHPEYARDEDFLALVRLLLNRTKLAVRLMMHPEKSHWQRSIAMGEKLKGVEGSSWLHVEYVPLQSGFGLAESQPLKYEDWQSALFSRSTFFQIETAPELIGQTRPFQLRNVADHRVQYSNGTTELVRPNELVARERVNFHGWTCYAGVDSLFIDASGDVFPSACQVGGRIGNIQSDRLEFPKEPLRCTRTFCPCGDDITIRKQKRRLPARPKRKKPDRGPDIRVSRWLDRRISNGVIPARIRLAQLLDPGPMRGLRELRISAVWHLRSGHLAIWDGGACIVRWASEAIEPGGEIETVLPLPAGRNRRFVSLTLEIKGELTLRAVRARFDSGENETRTRVSLPIYHTLNAEDFPLTPKVLRRLGVPRDAQLDGIRLTAGAPTPALAEISVGKSETRALLLPGVERNDLELRPPVPVGAIRHLHLKANRSLYVEGIELCVSSPKAIADSAHASTDASAHRIARFRHWSPSRRAERLFFRPYDPATPLFFMHVPKCAGISFRAALRRWFGNDYCEHYLDMKTLASPAVCHLGPGTLLAGHFTRSDGVDIETYYPQARQLVTIIRDPFEISTSSYFFLKNEMKTWARKYDIGRNIRESLEQCLARGHTQVFDYLPKIPEGQSIERYVREHFAYVGLQDCLQDSANALAHWLGKPRVILPMVNTAKRDEEVPDLRAEFRRVFTREYELYDLVREMHSQAGFRTGKDQSVGLDFHQRRLPHRALADVNSLRE